MHLKCLVAAAFTFSSSVFALYTSRDNVIQADASNFKDIVIDTDHAVIVEFFAPWCGHCKALAPEYKKAADSLKGLAKVVAVDCDAEPNKPLCGQYQVQGFPTVKFFGKNKNSPSDYQGQRKAKDIVDFIIPQIPNNVQLVGTKSSKTHKPIEDFLLQAPELPKALLLSKKSATAPLLKGISTEFKNRLIVGEVRTATEPETLAKIETVYEKKFDTYPVLLVFPKGVSSADGVVVYDGELKNAPLTAFLNKYAVEKPKKAKKEAKKGDAKKDGKKSEKKAKKGEKKVTEESEVKQEEGNEELPFDPTVPEIVNQGTLDSLCIEKSGVCAVAVLTLESEFEESVSAHKSELAVLEKLNKKYHERKSPFQFTWVNAVNGFGDKQEKAYFLEQFDMADSYPGLFIVNAKKGVYRIHRGGFDEVGIEGFLEDVLKGRGRNIKFDFKVQIEKGKKEERKEEKEEKEEEKKKENEKDEL